MLEGDITEILTSEHNGLQFIYVEENLFTGTIDNDFLLNYTELIQLDMSGNAFDGTVPSHFFDMQSLEVLDLHDNMLVGSLPEIPNNNVLSFVALHQNQITGPIPDSITKLGNLRHLDLSQNMLVGPMSTLLNNVTTLTYVFLAENDFSQGDIPDYSNLVNLREFSLKNTRRTGRIPDFLAGMNDLILLDLDGTWNVFGQQRLDIGIRLSYVFLLADNQLTGSFPEFLVNMTSLKAILLNRNMLSGPIPSGLDNLEDLRLLYVDRNSLTGSLEELCALDAFSRPESSNHLAADCGTVGVSTFEVNCTCCTHCCTDGNTDGCHDNYIVPSVDPIWEMGFERPGFRFGNETSFSA